MSKCHEEYEKFEARLVTLYGFANWQVKDTWQAAWNAATENAAKVCEVKADEFHRLYSREADGAVCCAEAIRKEKTE